MSWLLIAMFAVLCALGVPLAVALGAAALITLFLHGFPLSIVPQTMYTSMNNFLLVAVPLFILAGNLMDRGGMSERIFNFANSLVGRWKGGLGQVNVASSMIFGGISGSSVADVASLGPLQVKAMTKNGYPKAYAAGLTMVTATMASVIPPSILMIVAAATAGASVGDSLAAGLGPGLLIAGAFVVTNYYLCRRRDYGEVQTSGLNQGMRSLLAAVPALVTPIIILGGIFTGFVTPTEAAALAVVYTLLVSAVFYRSLRLRDLPDLLIRTGKTTGTILLIAMSASIATYIFASDGLPAQVSGALLSFSDSTIVILLLMALVLIVVGMVMDIIAALFLLIPVLLPTATAIGMDPIHFVVFVVAALAVGLASPPVGVCLFATSYVTRLSIEEIARAALPYYVVLLVAIVLVALVPALTLWPVWLFGL